MLLQPLSYLAAAEVWDAFRWQHPEIPDSVSALKIFQDILDSGQFTEFKDRRDDAEASPHEELISLVNHRLNEAMMETGRRRILAHDSQLRLSGNSMGDTPHLPGVAGSAIYHVNNQFSQRCHLRFRVTETNISVALRTFARAPALGRDLFILALGKPNTGPNGSQPMRLMNALSFARDDIKGCYSILLPVLDIAQRYAVDRDDRAFLSALRTLLTLQEEQEKDHAAG